MSEPICQLISQVFTCDRCADLLPSASIHCLGILNHRKLCQPLHPFTIWIAGQFDEQSRPAELPTRPSNLHIHTGFSHDGAQDELENISAGREAQLLNVLAEASGPVQRGGSEKQGKHRQEPKTRFGGITWGFDATAGRLKSGNPAPIRTTLDSTSLSPDADAHNGGSELVQRERYSRWGLESGGPGREGSFWYAPRARKQKEIRLLEKNEKEAIKKLCLARCGSVHDVQSNEKRKEENGGL